MNPYIKAQLLNMRMTVKNCTAACHSAAKQDDGVTDCDEACLLKKVDKLTAQFLKGIDSPT